VAKHTPRRTLSSLGATMAGEIGLACILKSDTSSQSVFRVSIHGDKLVEDLREGIKAKKHVALANVDASDLRVWMVRTNSATLSITLTPVVAFL
jgi:hypothetical protein